MYYTFGDLVFHPSRNVLVRSGIEGVLAPKTSDLLKLLLDRRGTVLTREEIQDTLWPQVVVSDAALWFQISKLREALGESADYIRTVPRRGYAWESPEVRIASEEMGAEGGRAAVPMLPLVGRKAEFEELRRRLHLVLKGESHFVVISGEAGCGKTRLASEIEREASASGVRAHHTQFMPSSRGLPYQPFCDIFVDHFRTGSGVARRGNPDVADLAAPLLAIFPILSEIADLRTAAESTAPSLSAPALAGSRPGIYDVFARTLVRIAQGRPRLLLFEDMQESEDGLEALQYIVRRLAPTPTLVIGTAQTDTIARHHPLHRFLADFRNDRHFAHLPLAPLTREETGTFLASLDQRGELPAGIVERYYAATGGNPLFIREIYFALRQTEGHELSGGTGQEVGDRLGLPLDRLPQTIEQAVARRLQRLPEALRELLVLASVLGTSFRPEDVRPFVTADLDVEEAADTLVREGLLVEMRAPGRSLYRFANPMMAGVLYASLPRSRRRDLHRLYAEELEKRPTGPDHRGAVSERLHHYDRADVPAKVAEYGLKLASDSIETWANVEAMRAARVVLDHTEGVAGLEGPAGRAHLLLARANRVDWNWTAALEEIRAAVSCFDRAAGQAQCGCEAVTIAAEMAWEARRVHESKAWLDEGLARTARLPAKELRSRLFTLGVLMANLQADTQTATAFEAELEKLRAPASEETPIAVALRSAPLSVPISARLDDIDPALVFTVAQGELVAMSFETLTRPGADARIVPWLAEEFRPEDDGRAFRFRLRHDVRFHDGRIVTSADVRYSFLRLLRLQESRSRWLLAPIKGADEVMAGRRGDLPGFTILSGREFRIELESPMAFFPALTAHIATAVVPDGCDRFAASWKEGALGTGPYRVVGFEPGKSVSFERNPFYWRHGLPRTDRLLVSLGVQPAEAADGLCQGCFSVAQYLPPEEVVRLRANPAFTEHFVEHSALSTHYLALNIHRGPFADPAVRAAAIRAVDVDELVGKHLRGLAQPARQMIPPELADEAPVASRSARTDQPGVPPGTEIVGILNPAFETTYKALADALLARLGDAGFAVRIDRLPQPEYHEALRAASVDFVLTAWVADYPDADNFAYGLFQSSEGIVGRFCGTAELDELIERGRMETEWESRRWIYRRFETKLKELDAVLPVFHHIRTCLVHPRLAGARLGYFVPFLFYEELYAR